jgi:hypothetical protein
MRIYLSCMIKLSLLSEADSPDYTNTISDTLMRISTEIIRRDQAPSPDMGRKFIEENPNRGFAREFFWEFAVLRLYIFGR